MPAVVVAERHRSRSVRLLAGSQMTPWAGLGVLGGHVLLGAGERGLLVLDRRFGGEDRALAVDVDGSCLDLAVRGDSVYVLVETATETVVRRLVFDRPRGRFVVAGVTNVPGRWESFVR